MASAIVLAAAVGTLIFMVGRTDSARALARIDANSAGAIDPGQQPACRPGSCRSRAGRIAAGFESLWVVNDFDNTVSRIDPSHRSTADDPGRRRSDCDRRGSGIRVGRVHRHANRRPDRPTAEQEHGADTGRKRTEWDRDQPRRRVGHEPPRRHRDEDRLEDRDGPPAHLNAGASPSDIAYGLGALWIANESTSTVTRIDPRTGGLQEFNVGNGPEAIAIGSGSVWVANSLDGTISRIDPTTHVITSVTVGSGPSSLLASDGSIWVADSYGGRIVRIDPSSMDIVRTIAVGSDPQSLAALEGGLAERPRDRHRPPRGHPTDVRVERPGLARCGPGYGDDWSVSRDQRRRTHRVQARGRRGRRHVGPRPCDLATGAHRRWENVHVPAAAGHPLLERRTAARERYSPRTRARRSGSALGRQVLRRPPRSRRMLEERGATSLVAS